jgi:5-methylcytosine-specific restriction enzyme A
MPWSCMTPCLESGCNVLVRRGRCERHARQRATAVAARPGRRKTAERGYGGRWQRARAAFLREFPLCGQRPGGLAPVMSRCHAEGRIVAATHVDHVVPHKNDPALLWDAENNWQSLCGRCSAAKSGAGL